MAGHLASNGYNVKVFNRTKGKSEKWCSEFDGQKRDTPKGVSSDADYIFCCVGNDDDLREVTYGEQGIFSGVKPEAIMVDHTTTSAMVARELNDKGKSREFHFLDAPVSGGQAGAEQGTLTVMVGGEEAAFDKASVPMNSYAQAVTLMRKSGAGKITKW